MFASGSVHLLIDADNQPAKMAVPLMRFLKSFGFQGMTPWVVGNGNGEHVSSWVEQLSTVSSVHCHRIVPSIEDGADLMLTMFAGEIIAQHDPDKPLQIIIVSRDGLLLRLAELIASIEKPNVSTMIALADTNRQSIEMQSNIPVLLIPTRNDSDTSTLSEKTYIRPMHDKSDGVSTKQPKSVTPNANKLFRLIIQHLNEKGMIWNKNKCVNLTVFESAITELSVGLTPQEAITLLSKHVVRTDREGKKGVIKLVKRMV